MTTFLDKAGLTYLWAKLKEHFQPKTIFINVSTDTAGAYTASTNVSNVLTAISAGKDVVYRVGEERYELARKMNSNMVYAFSVGTEDCVMKRLTHTVTDIFITPLDLARSYSMTVANTDAELIQQKSELTSFITNYGRPVSFLHMGSTTTIVGVTGKTTGGQWIALTLNGSGVTLYLMTEPQAPEFSIFDASGNFLSGSDGQQYIKGATLTAAAGTETSTAVPSDVAKETVESLRKKVDSLTFADVSGIYMPMFGEWDFWQWEDVDGYIRSNGSIALTPGQNRHISKPEYVTAGTKITVKAVGASYVCLAKVTYGSTGEKVYTPLKEANSLTYYEYTAPEDMYIAIGVWYHPTMGWQASLHRPVAYNPLRQLYVAAGALYNDTGKDMERTTPWGEKAVHRAGYYYLNGIGDIPEQEMAKIYTLTGHPGRDIRLNNSISADIRTTFAICRDRSNGGAGSIVMTGKNTVNMYYAMLNTWRLKVLSLCESDNEYVVLDDSSWYVAFMGCTAIERVIGIIDLRNVGIGNAIYFFSNNPKMKHIRFQNWKNPNFDFSKMQYLELECIQFSVQKAASPTRGVYLKLHPDAYARCVADTTEYTYNAETVTGIIALAEKKKISILCAE